MPRSRHEQGASDGTTRPSAKGEYTILSRDAKRAATIPPITSDRVAHRDGPAPYCVSMDRSRPAAGSRLPLVLLVVGLLALVVSGVGPNDRLTWWLEVAPVLIALPLLLWTRRTFPADAASLRR